MVPTDGYAGIFLGGCVYGPLNDYIGPNQRMWLLGYNVKNIALSRLADSKKIIYGTAVPVTVILSLQDENNCNGNDDNKTQNKVLKIIK